MSLEKNHKPGGAVAFTCCTCNHAARANTLGSSLAETNPDIDFVVCFVDRPAGAEPSRLTAFPSCFLSDTHGKRLHDMAARYSPFELSCAAKTLAGRRLMEMRPSADKFLYLDADIMVYASLEPALAALDEYAMVITPHARRPVTPDGRSPDDTSFLRHGAYNAGFFAFRRDAETVRIFDWLDQRLEAMCIDRPLSGLYVDQKWYDLLPVYFADGVGVLRHRGVNASYWNLHEVALTRSQSGAWEVGGGEPLVFFHFSGYNPDRPERVSSLQNRHSFESVPRLRELFDAYRDALLSNRDPAAASLPYGHRERRAEGIRRTPFFRRALRALVWRMIMRWKIDL